MTPESKAGEARLSLNRGTDIVVAGLGWVHGTYQEILPHAEPLLSHAEKESLETLEFPRRRESFLLGRYAAKRALRLMLNEPEGNRISLFPGVFDQPLVEYPFARGIGVTITHAEKLALGVAFPAGHPMGIDVERKAVGRLALLSAQMMPAECAWAEVSSLDALTVATMLWTAKEALAKALTTGLMSPWEIYVTSEWKCVREGIWESRFVNFAQYRAITWITDELVFSLALPKNSLWAPETESIIAGALRG